MGKIRVFGLAATLLVSLVAAGCAGAGPVACPAIGWGNTVGVELTGNTDAVATVEVCSDGMCTSELSLQPAPGPMPIETLDSDDWGTFSAPSTGTDVSPSPGSSMPFSVTREDEATWWISTDMSTPDSLTVRAVSATGEVLAERDVALTWRRVGGTAQCGGPGEAGPIGLDIPS